MTASNIPEGGVWTRLERECAFCAGFAATEPEHTKHLAQGHRCEVCEHPKHHGFCGAVSLGLECCCEHSDEADTVSALLAALKDEHACRTYEKDGTTLRPCAVCALIAEVEK